jgi:AraC-like DNA-binding protein
MTNERTTFEPLRLSTESFSARDRTAIWRDMICRWLIRVEISQPAGALPFHRLAMWELPGLSIIEGQGCPCTAARTPALVEDGKDDLLLNVNTFGPASAHWLGQDVDLTPGDAIIVPTAEPGEMRFGEDFGYLNLRIPRAGIAPFVRDLDQALMKPIPFHDEALRLLIGYVRLIQDLPPVSSEELRRAVALHLQDLLAVAVGATRDAEETAKGRGIGAARLADIKADITRSLDKGPVSADELAGRHGVSPVYIRKLFAREGTTLSSYVLEQRLSRAHRLLANPAQSHRSISDIAYAVGFGDLSYFNRHFRLRFDRTPSDVRAGKTMT